MVRRIVRLVSVLLLASTPVGLALERGLLLPAALAVFGLDLALDRMRHRRRGPTVIALRYGAFGPFALAVLALAGAPGEAVILALSWTLLCLLALPTLRTAAPLLAGAGLLALTPRPQVHDEERLLRVATFNLEWGRAGIDSLAETIRGLDADVVALQEVVDASDPNRIEDLLPRLREATGMEGVSARSPNDRPGFGTGILSRWPIRSVEYRDLPYVPAGKAYRTAVRARIEVRGVPIDVVSVHLDRPPYTTVADNTRQIRGVLDWIVGREPLILCGDFNAFPVYPGYRELSSQLQDLRERQRWPSGTWPSPWGLVRMDWIFSRGFRPVSQTVVRGGPSDHFPVVAELLLPEESVPYTSRP